MTQRAADVINLAAYRARRVQPAPSPRTFSSDLAQSGMVFAVPVLMPIVIAWLPVWSMAALSAGTPDE